MFLKEYRYILDNEEKIFHAVVTYGEHVNIVNVFMSQDMVQVSRQFNVNDFGYERVDEKNGYYINAIMEGDKGTVEYLDEFMNHYIMAMSCNSVKEIVCIDCRTNKFETFSHSNKIWCKECRCVSESKQVKLR